jgi:hypothetical protein
MTEESTDIIINIFEIHIFELLSEDKLSITDYTILYVALNKVISKNLRPQHFIPDAIISPKRLDATIDTQTSSSDKNNILVVRDGSCQFR